MTSLQTRAIRTGLARPLATLAKDAGTVPLTGTLAATAAEDLSARNLISWSAMTSFAMVNSFFKAEICLDDQHRPASKMLI